MTHFMTPPIRVRATAAPAPSAGDSAPLVAAGAGWTRRAWLGRNAAFLLAVQARPTGLLRGPRALATDSAQAARLITHAALFDPSRFETLARQAVEAAKAVGARYADVRLTRTVQHHFDFAMGPAACVWDLETTGVGVRVLVDGYWGFAASPTCEPDEAVRLSRAAVAQAKANARGTSRPVELGTMPVVTGRWATPVKIDPFAVSIEEKADFIEDWVQLSHRHGVPIQPLYSWLHCARQERTVATSEGSCVSQTRYETGGIITCGPNTQTTMTLLGLDFAGKGWELFLDAKIPEQLAGAMDRLEVKYKPGAKPATIGRYTIVCDGATMGQLVAQTFGIATQLDRALGYEANAGGTSFITDPLGTLGTFQVAASTVTITANRSAPAELATVQWDDEGVVPEECTLVKHGVLHDFQTTREQAVWLAPYYQKIGQPVRSHGYAGAEEGFFIPLQQMPNFALQPGAAGVRLEDLVANVKDGILVTAVPDPYGSSLDSRTDHQARNGFFGGELREIRNGRPGKLLTNGTILFNTQDLWKHVVALAGPVSEGTYAAPSLNMMSNLYRKWFKLGSKGQPPQVSSYSARGVAATITDQALINFARKA